VRNFRFACRHDVKDCLDGIINLDIPPELGGLVDTTYDVYSTLSALEMCLFFDEPLEQFIGKYIRNQDECDALKLVSTLLLEMTQEVGWLEIQPIIRTHRLFPELVAASKKAFRMLVTNDFDDSRLEQF
jgi:hypothetical protein